jgi:diguanylate cyclase (GGDEF)-like protein
MNLALPTPPIPAHALLVSGAALIIPVIGQLLFIESVAEYEVMLWLLALVPAFLLAYHRGWRGVASSLACGMAFLSLAQAFLTYQGVGIENWAFFYGVLVVYVVISLGIGAVTELLHQARKKAEQLAFTDPLTGLPNRRLADLLLDMEFAAAQRGRPLVLAIFDLDHFKQYNDLYGHVAGDDALAAFGQVLAQQTRRMNASARYGGEEFISIVSEANIPGAMVFVDRVRNALAALELPAPVTVSVGLAEYERSMRSPRDLYAAADRALYQAKHDGRDTVRVYSLDVPAPELALAG